MRDQPDIAYDPTAKPETSPNRPFQLYRFITPPAALATRNLAFAGMTTTISTSIVAQAQALWICAFFDAKLDRLPSRETAQWEAVLHSRFGKWRYPCGYGARLPDFVFDAVPYVDMLLRDVGVKTHRKKSKIAEIWEPYGAADYKGLVNEWKRTHVVTPSQTN